ncbi:GlxA family transcriptional regulator [Actinoplanes regularis]|uniref:Transcriptional regulator, AraC family with amidase-like domain n=1 Tax=Actinoplanes regularis TaxID=52697 RepID=A0A238US16_9ACTN|nr:AraC family transcriptional regulator [Actinoplanes regularis]GIE84570.1 transcriptional regulator [Actinoplanes regularis]SNR24119.1 transcriptional regulator, AraC family with amidase-like domain [Actinoplanes regularis]
MSQVVFVLTPQVHLLDLAGPAQVFSTAPGYSLHYVAETESVPTWQGVVLQATVEWPALTPEDLVLVPGWRSGHGYFGRATLDRIAAHHAAGGTVASVCSGADALGRAGLLSGRRCTTHHDLQETLARGYPRASVVRDVLYVSDDRVVTSAGIASGIDLALHLVALRHGPAVAGRVAREMVVYARRNGDEQQASAMLRHRAHLSDVVHRVQDRIDASFAEPLRLAGLAAGTGVSERTLTRQFTAATGQTPLRYQQLLRVERAEHLIGHGSTVEAAARAVGFGDARMLRRLRSRSASLPS